MTQPLHIIAEAAQGYEGSPDIAKLLVRAAAAGGADAVKFQIVYADDLAVPGYKYFDLFRTLEMDDAAWTSVRAEAAAKGLDFVADVFGPRSFATACQIGADSLKLHSTTFFEDGLAADVLAAGKRVYLSVGGIEQDEIAEAVARFGLTGRDVVLMFGYQAEPTPTDRNNLARIAALRELTGLEIGFMDHSDGAGEDTVSVSVMALALGVRVFEKHIGLDRALELEDHVSALPPGAFAAYARALRRNHGALGDATLALTGEEKTYRESALKRVVAAQDLPSGTVLSEAHLRMARAKEGAGLFDPREAIGRELARAVPANAPITAEALK